MGVPFPDRRAIVLALACLTCAVLPGTAFAQKIAVIDYQQIFDAYEGTSDAQKQLDLDLDEWDKQATEMRQEIDTLQEEFESQRLMLSEDRLQEKEDELRRKRDEYQRFAEEIWGVNGKAASRNAELTKPIAEKILETVAQYGNDTGLDIILDAGTGGVVWAKDDVNVTDDILNDIRATVTGTIPEETE